MFPKKRARPQLQVQRRAGQSLRERWQELVEDRLIPIVFGPFFLWVMVVVEWMQHALEKPLPLDVWLSAAVVATGASVIAFLRLIPKARSLVRGERGELVVAERLEELRATGFRCFHDIVRGGFFK